MPARHARPSRTKARVAVTTALSGALLPLLSTTHAEAAEPAPSTVRVSGPGGAVAPGNVPVTARLLSGNAYVKNGVVDLQVREGDGWRTVSRVATDGNGLGRGTVAARNDVRVRAYYRGSSARTPAASASIVIDVADRGRQVLAEASRHRGKPYRYGATGPSAFDCSGYTRYVYSRFGKTLPHSARGQEDATRSVPRSQARPGDLVFIQDVSGHVGIYAGNGRMWDAPRSGKTVQLRDIWTDDYTIGRV
jgi:cell wall-associated NlpC family hydrolase